MQSHFKDTIALSLLSHHVIRDKIRSIKEVARSEEGKVALVAVRSKVQIISIRMRVRLVLRGLIRRLGKLTERQDHQLVKSYSLLRSSILMTLSNSFLVTLYSIILTLSVHSYPGMRTLRYLDLALENIGSNLKEISRDHLTSMRFIKSQVSANSMFKAMQLE